MNSKNFLRTRGTQRFVIIAALIIILALFFGESSVGVTQIFNFRYNPYALLSISGVTTIAIFLYMLRKMEVTTSETVWFSVMMTAFMVFGIAETFQRLSATPEGANFWGTILGFGAGFEPAAMFLFVLHYVNPVKRHIGTVTMLLLAASFIFFFQVGSQIIFKTDMASTHLGPWGYYNDIGDAFLLNGLWVYAITIPSLVLLKRYRKRSTNKVLRAQARLVFYAILFPIVGAVTDLIGPAISPNIPPLHIFFVTVTSGLIIYAMRRYKFFRVSPSTLSESVLNTMRESVVVVNSDLKVELLNSEAEKLFQIPAEDAVGKHHISKFFSESDAAKIQQSLGSIDNKLKTQVVEDLVIDSDRHKVYVQATVSTLSEDYGSQGYILVFNDVTALKESYAALEHEKANVEHTVQVRTKELREAQAKLLETDKLKTEFVMLTSHNLRTPYTVVRGDVDLLSTMELEKDKQKELLQDVQSNLSSLGTLIEDLLTISTIEAGQNLTRDDSTLDEFIKPLIDDAKRLSSETKNKLNVKTSLGDNGGKTLIKVNSKRLQTAIRNIIDNAFKFTKNGEVNIDIAKSHKDMVIVVKDTGIGIKSEEIPKLFTKFHRGTDTLTFDYVGKGIGLYLCKLIVEEHGGTIDLESELGKGTEVTVTVPLEAPKKQSPK